MRYEYSSNQGRIINVIHYHVTQNKKLGEYRRLIATYHFSLEQVEQISLTPDRNNCLDCPLSFSNAEEGNYSKCYTHKGMQRLGLLSRLRSLNKRLDKIGPYDVKLFNKFLKEVRNKPIDIIRFGVYGSTIYNRLSDVKRLAKLGKHVGYTHQWTKPEYQGYSQYFMASTHSQLESQIANDMGWRVFNTGQLAGAVNCPASAESGRKTVCSSCFLCGGTTANSQKNIFIEQH